MYTLDYVNSLHVDLEEWNTDPESLVLPDQYYLGQHFKDDQLEPLTTSEEIEDLMDGIEALISDDLCIGCIKCFTVKDADGNVIGECEPYS